MTRQRIREWYEHRDGDVYVSFSGGKDSTVLLHIVREMYPDMPAVFSDTGLEFPGIREFVKSTPNVTWVRPEISFHKVIEKCGYPVIGKEQAEWFERIQRGNPAEMLEKLHGIRCNGSLSRFRLSEQWQYMLGAPFKIGAGCCNEMKKKPMKKYAAETGRVPPIIATMAQESKLRTQQWLKNGCNAFEAKKPISTPMSFWLLDINVTDIDCVVVDLDLQRKKALNIALNKISGEWLDFDAASFDVSQPGDCGGLAMTHILAMSTLAYTVPEGGKTCCGLITFLWRCCSDRLSFLNERFALLNSFEPDAA